MNRIGIVFIILLFIVVFNVTNSTINNNQTIYINISWITTQSINTSSSVVISTIKYSYSPWDLMINEMFGKEKMRF